MKVDFPDKVWGRLASIAEKREMSVADLLVESAEDLIGVPRRQRKTVQPIDLAKLTVLHAQGMSDGKIARALNASEGGVRYRRIQLGLPQVRERAPRKTTTTNPKGKAA